MPVPLSALGDPEAGWSTSDNAPGEFDTSFDLWIGPDPYTAPSAEIMIWIDGRNLPPLRPQRAWVGGIEYELWIKTAHNKAGRSWPCITFRRSKAATSVTDLRLAPFIRFAEQHKLVRASAYLWDVAAGFEIWSGGTGLATKSFWVRP